MQSRKVMAILSRSAMMKKTIKIQIDDWDLKGLLDGYEYVDNTNKGYDLHIKMRITNMHDFIKPIWTNVNKMIINKARNHNGKR
jgi:hypothetical protein